MLRLFGAEQTLLPLTKAYLFPIKIVIPVFVFNQMLAAFLRNDNAPGLATAAVLGGGIFNVFGDYFFVFAMDMGILGAGLATAAGACITLLIMLTHFFSKRCTLKFVSIHYLFIKVKGILTTGFSTFSSLKISPSYQQSHGAERTAHQQQRSPLRAYPAD